MNKATTVVTVYPTMGNSPYITVFILSYTVYTSIAKPVRRADISVILPLQNLTYKTKQDKKQITKDFSHNMNQYRTYYYVRFPYIIIIIYEANRSKSI